MSRKNFLVLGLFLVAGFLFLNVAVVEAATYTWDGGGDTHTWTDCRNWDNFATDCVGGANSYPGATTTDAVIIGANARVIATTTLSASIASLVLGSGSSGSILTIAKNVTIAASSTIQLQGTSTLAFGDNSANTNAGGALNLGAGNLYLGLYSVATTSYPLSIGAGATFTAGTSTVTYAGVGRNYIATTTYYNLSLTPTSTAPTLGTTGESAIYTVGAGGNIIVQRALTLNASSTLNMNGRTLTLSNSITDASLATPTPLVYASDGAFVANNSTVVYSGTVATNIATGTYATLTISGAITKSLVGNTTAYTAVNVGALATLNLAGKTFTATGATWTNDGTVSYSTANSNIILSSVGVLSSSAGGSAVTSFGNVDALPRVHVKITDRSLNFDALTAETVTATVTGTSGITDAETITLTETAVANGIFQGSIAFQLSPEDVAGSLDYQGSGTVSYLFTDPLDSTDTETASASFTGTTPGGGGSSGSSSGSTAATTVTTTTTTATPATQTTTTAPATTAVPATTVSTPTLDSVQNKISSVVAKIAALPASPTATDLASIQAEIAAILVELQAVQSAQPATQGVALGFNFVRSLAQGLRHADVSKLQEALKTDSSIYPEGTVSGYFGPATLRAVKKFQEKYGIASSGDAGYGNVGPATRAKLNELFK